MEKITIDLKAGESVYFASDMHLGSGGFLRTREKEKLLLRWMDRIRPDCGALVLCGDVFDFWYEWKKVVPSLYMSRPTLPPSSSALMKSGSLE